MSSARKLVLGGLVYAVLGPLFLVLWLMLLGGIGELAHSGFMGICGPYGPLGNRRFVAALVGDLAVLVGAGLVTRRIVRRVHRRRTEREPIVSANRSQGAHSRSVGSGKFLADPAKETLRRN